MWPILIDMSKEESYQYLRHLELEAYSHLVSALRAQGSLNTDKRKILKETSVLLNISQERHNAEIRRAICDEKLNTVAFHVAGYCETMDDWAQEGRRLVPIIPRMAPQTVYSSIADEFTDIANKQTLSPSNTENKRSMTLNSNLIVDPSKSSFRIPDLPKFDDTKKRKFSLSENNSCLAQHLLGPSKASRIQQLYRQRTKSKTKDQYQFKIKDQEMINCKTQFANTNHPKINILQNISLHPLLSTEDSSEQLQGETHNLSKLENQNTNSIVPIIPNENQAPRNKIISNIKSTNVTLKQLSCPPTGPINESKTAKMYPKKTIPKTINSGQKLIVVSNAQTIPSSSILQRSLSIPFGKNISVKNFEKFKIVTNAPNVPVTGTSNSNNSVKQKVVTVRTNTSAKKIIPLSQLQVLNTKGNIKVLPLGGKILGKTVTSTASSPLYIMNTVGNVQTFSKTISSPVLISKGHENSGGFVSPVEDVSQNLEDSSDHSEDEKQMDFDHQTSPCVKGEDPQIQTSKIFDTTTEYSNATKGSEMESNELNQEQNHNAESRNKDFIKEQETNLTEPCADVLENRMQVEYENPNDAEIESSLVEMKQLD